ncbi:MAG: methyltransferase domain-containing protein [Alphaproteobacteria bacterium]|nr:methyltransferase domain-containing protein [Alphaproteobacteria bacterium]
MQGIVFDNGAQGDGLVLHDNQKLFVANTLKGEEIEYEVVDDHRANLVKILKASDQRAEPVCPYVEKCGGCCLQHFNKDAYQEHKLRYLRQLLPETFPEFDHPVFIDYCSRRRVSFAVTIIGKVCFFGLNQKNSDQITEIKTCPVLIPELNELIEPLHKLMKEIAFPVKKATGDVSLLLTDSGVDVLFTLPFQYSNQIRERLIKFAIEHNLARICWRLSERDYADIIVQPHAPVLKLGEYEICPPPGVFLQPSKAGEVALQEAVKEYLGNKPKNILDLFCGAGTFSLGILEKKKIIYGVDNAPHALEALNKASSDRIKVENRDLFKVPFYPDELEKFDAVIFDPPRAGAKKQAENLAMSDIPVIVAVSCNPVTFVRDAEILIKGGYKIEKIRPVDQFVFTPHLEVVALFRK